MVVAIKLESHLPCQDFSAGLLKGHGIEACNEIVFATFYSANHINLKEAA